MQIVLRRTSVRPLFLDICTHVEQQLCPLTSSLSVSHAAVSPVSGVMKTSSGLGSEVTVMTASTLLRDFYLRTKINKGESAPAVRQHSPSDSEWESEIKREDAQDPPSSNQNKSGSKVGPRDHSQLLSQWHCFIGRGFTPVEVGGCCFPLLVSCFGIFSPPPGPSLSSDQTSDSVALTSLHASFSAPEQLMHLISFMINQVFTQINKNEKNQVS